uniref:Zinc finger and BTB domain-containing protein 26-like n=1 Tax=Seriola lalandi dorsalis TaxID=1841481 RepID=A0A3B4YC19_SERLL
MSGSSDTLKFHLPTHGDSILCKMNALREDRRFCDVTLLLGGPQGATVQPLRFHAHRVVLAASSDFLRDQFLLHEGRAELSVGVVSSVEVGKRLLLSCYTGLLEVPLRELVSYLTAASALQMSQVVKKCSQAVSQYLNPTLAFLKLEGPSEEKEILQPDSGWPGPSSKNQEERDAAQPSTSIQETITEGGGAIVIQSKLRVSQAAKVHNQGLREVKGDRRVVKAKIEDAACCLNMLESEDGGGILAVHTSKPSYQVHHITELTDDSDCKLVQRPYLCRRCDRVFQHLESYMGHLKEHRQYLCLVCGKGFSQKSNLSHHIHAHTGVKPFRCPLCHKTFSQKAPLQDHLNLHTGDRPPDCNYCAVHFAHKPGLRRHLKDTHGKSNSLLRAWVS